MAGVLFVTWAGGGNVNPALALARLLTDNGIEVSALGPRSLTNRFAADGIERTPREPNGEYDQAAIAADVTTAVAGVRPDVAIVDYMMPGALCTTEAAGIPTAALVHTLYGALHNDADAPTMSMAASVDGVNELRARLGLPAITRFGELLDRARLVLVTSPPELDLVPERLAANVAYVGPVLEDAGPDAGWRPPDGDDPLVVVALGTTDMGEAALLGRILAALADEPVRVLATVGDHVDRDALAVPANATVMGYVRHAAVLPHAALVVTHAGLGTILAALANGCPLLCIPLGRDQPANADAVERLGAGRTLTPDAGPDDIRRAFRALLGPGSHRDAAAGEALSIGATGGRRQALDRIVALLP